MTTPLLIIALLGTEPALLNRYLDALSAVESGHNHRAVGKAGERTAFQISPSVWREYCRVPMAKAGPQTQRAVAKEILEDRLARFERRHGRNATAQEAYLLWHRPARVLNPRSVERERARRFGNLVNER